MDMAFLKSNKVPFLLQTAYPNAVAGALGGIRIRDPGRSPVIYPLSCRRKQTVCLEMGWATGFEPVTSCATERRLKLGF